MNLACFLNSEVAALAAAAALAARNGEPRPSIFQGCLMSNFVETCRCLSLTLVRFRAEAEAAARAARSGELEIDSEGQSVICFFVALLVAYYV